jgi:hypothetical protein
MRLLALLLIAIVAACALAAADRQKPLVVEPRAPGRWQFQNVARDPANVVPWGLNTRCTITSRNLPTRDPERTA